MAIYTKRHFTEVIDVSHSIEADPWVVPTHTRFPDHPISVSVPLVQSQLLEIAAQIVTVKHLSKITDAPTKLIQCVK